MVYTMGSAHICYIYLICAWDIHNSTYSVYYTDYNIIYYEEEDGACLILLYFYTNTIKAVDRIILLSYNRYSIIFLSVKKIIMCHVKYRLV